MNNPQNDAVKFSVAAEVAVIREERIGRGGATIKVSLPKWDTPTHIVIEAHSDKRSVRAVRFLYSSDEERTVSEDLGEGVVVECGRLTRRLFSIELGREPGDVDTVELQLKVLTQADAAIKHLQQHREKEKEHSGGQRAILNLRSAQAVIAHLLQTVSAGQTPGLGLS